MSRHKMLCKSALILTAAFLLIISFFLCGCARVIRDSSDELVMNRWEASLKGGAKVTLSFVGNNATLSVKSGDISSVLSGVCILSVGEFVICDEKTKENFPFSYTLYGDRVELSFQNSAIILEKC